MKSHSRSAGPIIAFLLIAGIFAVVTGTIHRQRVAKAEPRSVGLFHSSEVRPLSTEVVVPLRSSELLTMDRGTSIAFGCDPHTAPAGAFCAGNGKWVQPQNDMILCIKFDGTGAASFIDCKTQVCGSDAQ